MLRSLLISLLSISSVLGDTADTTAQLRRLDAREIDIIPTGFDWYPTTPTSTFPLAEATSVLAIPSMAAAVTGGGADATQAIPVPPPTLPPPSSDDPSASMTSSLIRITALPPAATSTRRDLRPVRKSFNTLYLAPLFAVLGVALGAVCAWIFLHCRSRRHGGRRYSNSFEPGPEYRMPSSQGEARHAPVRTYRPPEATPTARHARRASGASVNGERGIVNEPTGGWFTRMLSLRRTATTHTNTASAHDTELSLIHATQGNESYSHYDEYDPFLEVPSATRGTSEQSSTLANTAPMRSRSLLTTSFLSPGSLGDEDSWEEVPYDTLRHKSIRRGILDRLKNGTMYRNGHKREDSDHLVEALRASGGPYSPLAHDSPTRGRTRASSTTAVPVEISQERSGPGFRIVEDTEAGLGSYEDAGWKWSLPWTSSQNRLPTEDKFTALPSRRSIAEKRKSPSPSPVKSRFRPSGVVAVSGSAARPTGAPRIDTSVLPSSPPLLVSSPLETALFFGPITSNIGAGSPTKSPGRSRSRKKSTVTSKAKKRNESHVPDEPSLLPFPSNGTDSPYRHRLTKQSLPPRDMTPVASPVTAAHLMSHSPPFNAKQTRSPDEQFAMQHGALDRVDAILARSWSERELRGEERPSSPTMFGALTVPEHSPLGRNWDQEIHAMGGIEERLGKSRP